MHGLRQLIHLRGFQEITRSSSPEGLLDLVPIGGDAQKNQFGFGQPFCDLSDGLAVFGQGQRQVEDDDVGLALGSYGKQRLSISGRTDKLEFRLQQLFEGGQQKTAITR